MSFCDLEGRRYDVLVGQAVVGTCRYEPAEEIVVEAAMSELGMLVAEDKLARGAAFAVADSPEVAFAVAAGIVAAGKLEHRRSHILAEVAAKQLAAGIEDAVALVLCSQEVEDSG
jgi:hypothetical protein